MEEKIGKPRIMLLEDIKKNETWMKWLSVELMIEKVGETSCLDLALEQRNNDYFKNFKTKILSY